MPQETPPSEMEALVPVPGGSMCTKFQNGLDVNQVFYDWFAYMYTEGGEFTTAFQNQLNEAREA